MRSCTKVICLLWAISIGHVASQIASLTLPTLVLPPIATPLGNPTDIEAHPLCAQACINSTVQAVPYDATLPENFCGADFRGLTAACEEVTCGSADYQRTQQLGTQLCGPLYSNNSALSSSVASAIASATSVAVAVTTGKSAFSLSSYPECSQKCTIDVNYGGCPGFDNATCLCVPPSTDIVGSCEAANCSPSDLQRIADLAYILCAPASDIGVTNTSNVSTSSTPTPVAFTGGANVEATRARSLIMVAFSVGVTGGLYVLFN